MMQVYKQVYMKDVFQEFVVEKIRKQVVLFGNSYKVKD